MDSSRFSLFCEFLHSSSYPGIMCAVGSLGFKAAMGYELYRISTVPQKLFFFPLSSSRVGDMIIGKPPAMKGGKFLPDIVDIEGLFYVLSGPSPSYNPHFPEIDYTFEVYDPEHNIWEQLDDPPLMNSGDNCFYPNLFDAEVRYMYLVTGHKLFVSNGVLSCVYDTNLRKWSASPLLSGEYYSSKGEIEMPCRDTWEDLKRHNQVKGCSPGLPFLGRDIYFKDDVILCMLPVQPFYPLAVFKVTYSSDDGDGNDVMQQQQRVETGVERIDISYAEGLPLEAQDDADQNLLILDMIALHWRFLKIGPI